MDFLHISGHHPSGIAMRLRIYCNFVDRNNAIPLSSYLPNLQITGSMPRLWL